MPDKLLSPEYGLSNSKLEECTANPSDVMNGKTFYSGDKNKKTGTFSFTGNADPGNVKAGLTFYAGDKTLKTGTLQDLGSEPRAAGGTLYNNGVYFYIGENGGQGRYIVQRGVYWDFASVANLIGLTADKIKSGEQILGIWGNYTGVNPNMKLVNRTVSWGSGVIFSGDDTSASKACQFGLQYYANSTYNVHIEFRIYRNNSRIDTIYINREGGLMYDPRGYIAKWYEGSGTYKYDVNVTYNAGNGSLMIGGMIVGY